MTMILDDSKNKIKSLKIFEKKLEDLLGKVDQEINQTEVEWLHLKSLIEEHNSTVKGGGSMDVSKHPINEATPKFEMVTHEPLNTYLNLNPIVTSKREEEEFDSDSD